MPSEPLLRVRDLHVTFGTESGPVHALRGVDLDVLPSEHLAIMGESGCGKSVLGHSMMRLLDDIANVRGRVEFEGEDVYSMEQDALYRLRGRKVCLIPQSPATSLDPVIKVGKQIDEALQHAGISDEREARRVTLEYLAKVGFLDPESIYGTYPHRLSGGMCERALIAMAICTRPALIIADEPTKGLDTLSWKRMMVLLHEVTEESSLIVITHDFRAAATCKRIAVMYAGEIVEEGPTTLVLSDPGHPYTKGLIASQPTNGLVPIPGKFEPKADGCHFRGRCGHATDRCGEHPTMFSRGETKTRCYLAQA